MGNAFLYGASGGASLNFKIIPYATEEALLAATPAENTIGVITEHKITSWIFAPSEPTAPAEGMLWIAVGTGSAVGFNALKKNGIYLYLASCKQYVGGEWVNIGAYIYQGGAWVQFSAEWSGELFADGDEFIDITGGWTVSDGGVYFTNKKTIENGLLVFEAQEGGSGAYAYMYTKNPIDLTGIANISANIVEHINPSDTEHTIAVWKTEPNTYNSVDTAASKQISGTDTGVHSVDVSSLSGLYYVGFCITSRSYSSTYYIKTDRFWMK